MKSLTKLLDGVETLALPIRLKIDDDALLSQNLAKLLAEAFEAAHKSITSNITE